MKLKESFMTSDTIDYFMSLRNGANYVVLYQMLCLKTINTSGRLSRKIGEIVVPYDAAKIQRDVKWFSVNTIRTALELYQAVGLIYKDDDGTLVLTDHANLVGSETTYAQQKRNQRENPEQKKSPCVDVKSADSFEDTAADKGADKEVENVHIDIRDRDKEIKRLEIRDNEREKKEREKRENGAAAPTLAEPEISGNPPVYHKHGAYGWVRLTDEQYRSLVDDLGSEEAERCIAYVDESAQGNGNKNRWKDWNLVVRRCHREGWGKRAQQRQTQEQSGAMPATNNEFARVLQKRGAFNCE